MQPIAAVQINQTAASLTTGGIGLAASLYVWLILSKAIMPAKVAAAMPCTSGLQGRFSLPKMVISMLAALVAASVRMRIDGLMLSLFRAIVGLSLYVCCQCVGMSDPFDSGVVFNLLVVAFLPVLGLWLPEVH